MRRTSLCQNDVVRPKELTNTRPQPVMRNYLRTTLRYHIVEFGDRNLACNLTEVLKFNGKLGNELLHPNPRKHCILYPRAIMVELIFYEYQTMNSRQERTDFDLVLSRNVTVEITRIEVSQKKANQQDEFCSSNLFLYLGKAQSGSPVDLRWF